MRQGGRGFERESAIFFFHARLALAIDGARCVDQASPESVATGYEVQPYFRPVIELVSKMSKRDSAFAMLEAISLENMRGERPLLAGLCTRGAATMMKALTAGRRPEPAPTPSSGAPTSLGHAYTVDVSGIEPELIPEDQWRAKRKELLDAYTRTAVEAL